MWVDKYQLNSCYAAARVEMSKCAMKTIEHIQPQFYDIGY